MSKATSKASKAAARGSALHTPGPWEVVWSSNTGRPMEILGPDRRKIVRWAGLGGCASADTSANAKLIAAAPALADALTKALKELGGTNIMGEELNATLNAEIRTALSAAGRLP